MVSAQPGAQGVGAVPDRVHLVPLADERPDQGLDDPGVVLGQKQAGHSPMLTRRSSWAPQL